MKPKAAAFTLIELMVVISIIALVGALVLPTVGRLFAASSHEQARSVFGAMLGRVRATAIEEVSYTAVHAQIGKDGHCWAISLIGEGDDANMVFVRLPGSVPSRMPGHIAFGGISDRFVQRASSSGLDAYKDLSDTQLRDFTTFTVAFRPDGTLGTEVAGADLRIHDDPKLFSSTATETAIWQTCPPPERGVRALAYFPYAEMEARTPAERANYLNDNAGLIALHPLTGRLLKSE